MERPKIKKIGTIENGMPAGWDLIHDVGPGSEQIMYSMDEFKAIIDTKTIPFQHMYTEEELSALNDQFKTLAVGRYNIVDATINQWKTDFMILKIKDVDDKDTFKTIHDNRMLVKNTRVGIEKKRKELNKDPQKEIDDNNAEAKRIVDQMNPIETHLENEEKAFNKLVDAKKAEDERLKRVKMQHRVSQLLASGMSFDGVLYSIELEQIMPDDPDTLAISLEDVEKMDDEKFNEDLSLIQSVFRLQENKRAQEKLAQEELAQKVLDDLAELDRQKAELEQQKVELTELKQEIIVESEKLEEKKKEVGSYHFPASSVPAGIAMAQEDHLNALGFDTKKTLMDNWDDVECLTKENFWNELTDAFPEPVKEFGAWIDGYKKRVKWNALFCDCSNYHPKSGNSDRNTPSIKYHDLPIAFQFGIFLQYVFEKGDDVIICRSKGEMIGEMRQYFFNKV